MNIIKQILDFLKNLLDDETKVEPFVERKVKKTPKRVSKTSETQKTIKKTKSAKKTKSTNKKTS